MAHTRAAAGLAAALISLAVAGPALACSKDDTAYFDTFLDASCLLTPLQDTDLDPLGGIRLATNGTATATNWDTDTEFTTGRVGVSTLAVSGANAAATLTLPTTFLPLTAD